MRCYECGCTHAIAKYQDYMYSECGLENVVLKSIEMIECRDCKAKTPVIFSMDGLHYMIMRALTRKRRPTPNETLWLQRNAAQLASLSDIATWNYRRRGRLIECFLVVEQRVAQERES